MKNIKFQSSKARDDYIKAHHPGLWAEMKDRRHLSQVKANEKRR